MQNRGVDYKPNQITLVDIRYKFAFIEVGSTNVLEITRCETHFVSLGLDFPGCQFSGSNFRARSFSLSVADLHSVTVASYCIHNSSHRDGMPHVLPPVVEVRFLQLFALW